MRKNVSGIKYLGVHEIDLIVLSVRFILTFFLKKSDVEKKLNMFRYGSEEQSEQAEGEIRKEEV